MNAFNKYKEWRLKRHIKKFGHKNIGYFCYFDNEWFKKHQSVLIWLLNQPILKYWFRWILRIQKDCGFNEYIDKIEPHTYRVKLGKNEYRSDFRTHNKFSKRIYYAFRPLWWTLHILDYVIQRTIAPEFSFGFDTLTILPQAGSGGSNTTCDGILSAFYATNDSKAWNEIISANFSNYVGLSGGNIIELRTGEPENTFNRLSRTFLAFDTSSIPDNAIFSSVYVGIKFNYVWNYYTNYGRYYTLVPASVANPNTLTTSNYADFSRVSLPVTGHAVSDIQSFIDLNAYNWIGIAGANYSHIKKDAITQMFVIGGEDYNNSGWWAFPQEWGVIMYGADEYGIDSDPAIQVTYALPTAQKQCMII